MKTAIKLIVYWALYTPIDDQHTHVHVAMPFSSLICMFSHEMLSRTSIKIKFHPLCQQTNQMTLNKNKEA